MNIHILGKGAWGAALGHTLQKNGHSVQWSDHTDPALWMEAIDFVLLVVPSKFLLAELRRWPRPVCPVISAVKGIEPDNFKRVSEIVEISWGSVKFAALSGPSFAEEVSKDMPTAVVAASADQKIAEQVQQLFHRPEFRVYRSDDVTGLELGGALKNVYAIAAGQCAALGLGANTQAALVTRALAEMVRVGTALGGRRETFMGLSGVGDLMLTCYGGLSRNRQFGEWIVKDRAQAATMIAGVAEGVTSVKAICHLASLAGVHAPLAEEIYKVIYDNKSPEEALRDLLARAPVEEIR